MRPAINKAIEGGTSLNALVKAAGVEQARRQQWQWNSDHLTAWDIIRYHKLRGRNAIERAFPSASYRQALESHRKWMCGLSRDAFRDYTQRLRDEQHFLYRRLLPSDD